MDCRRIELRGFETKLWAENGIAEYFFSFVIFRLR